MAMLKYNEKFPAIAEDLAANGESDAYIAFRLQISIPTFYNYKAQFPEFAEALVVGRKVCYSRVRAKLLKLAQGRCTVITEVYKDGKLYKTIERQLPPNLKAIIYFQKHMRVGKITINENTLPQEDSKMSNGRLSGVFCLRQDGQMPVENTLPQEDSKMSNVVESQTEQTCQTRPTCPTTAPVENTLPQQDYKMSNLGESPTCPTCPTCPTVPAAESSLPQTDSKMSNERLPGEFCLRQ